MEISKSKKFYYRNYSRKTLDVCAKYWSDAVSEATKKVVAEVDKINTSSDDSKCRIYNSSISNISRVTGTDNFVVTYEFYRISYVSFASVNESDLKLARRAIQIIEEMIERGDIFGYDFEYC